LQAFCEIVKYLLVPNDPPSTNDGSRRLRRQPLDHYPLDLIEGDLIALAIPHACIRYSEWRSSLVLR